MVEYFILSDTLNSVKFKIFLKLYFTYLDSLIGILILLFIFRLLIVILRLYFISFNKLYVWELLL